MLIATISRLSGMRLPDAARVAFYRQDFAGPTIGAWTQRAMRGPSTWSVSERELMAAMVATWNMCPFCVGAHSAVAIRGMPKAVVDDALADFRAAPISDKLKAALAFIEKLTMAPEELTAVRQRHSFGAATADKLREQNDRASQSRENDDRRRCTRTFRGQAEYRSSLDWRSGLVRPQR
ncbi:carboxymuconolactone decarboxylase family protein [Leifsonia sp. 2MCAF36]|uniref:carboxymuconolactone decarboxylase family protein n=1 Tax=Leifsonia sp. 2MCAF36 TaxID=3232988 RepID=UPI003F985574